MPDKIVYIPSEHGYMGIILQDPAEVAERIRAQMAQMTAEERIMAASRYMAARMSVMQQPVSPAPEQPRFDIVEKLPRDLWEEQVAAESLLSYLWLSKLSVKGGMPVRNTSLSMTPVGWGRIDDDSLEEVATGPDGPWTFVTVRVSGPAAGLRS